MRRFSASHPSPPVFARQRGGLREPGFDLPHPRGPVQRDRLGRGEDFGRRDQVSRPNRIKLPVDVRPCS